MGSSGKVASQFSDPTCPARTLISPPSGGRFKTAKEFIVADHPIFQGQVALVTGGSSGIGRAASLAFAAQGAKVVVASRRTDEGQETVRLIQAIGGESIFV